MRQYTERYAIALSRMLSDARIDAGLIQSELAARLHVGLRTIRRHELGESTPRAAFVELWLRECGARCVIHTFETPRRGEAEPTVPNGNGNSAKAKGEERT